MTIEAILAIGFLTIIVVFALLTGAIVALVREVGDGNRLLQLILDELQRSQAEDRLGANRVPAFFAETNPNQDLG